MSTDREFFRRVGTGMPGWMLTSFPKCFYEFFNGKLRAVVGDHVPCVRCNKCTYIFAVEVVSQKVPCRKYGDACALLPFLESQRPE